MNRLSRIITKTCESLVILHSDSNKPTVIFSCQCKYTLTETSYIPGKLVISK